MIFFKAEANNRVGGGHLHRCISIAKACRDQDIRVGFIFADTPLQEQKKVSDEGFDIFNIDKEDEKDSGAYLKLIPGNNLVFFDTDNPFFYSGKLIDDLRNKGIKTACYAISDSHLVTTDLLLNANVIAKSLNYSTANYTKKLLGPGFMIFHKDFRNRSFDETTLSFPADVMVYFGNADVLGLTLRFLDLPILLSDKFRSIKVVVGSLNKDSDAIRNKIGELQNGKFELIVNTPRISEVYEKVNLALVSGGMSIFELSLFGVPMVVFPSGEREQNYVRYMNTLNYVATVENAQLLSDDELMQKTLAAITDQGNKKYLIHHLKELINPNGIHEIVNEFQRSIELNDDK